jgi:predicted DNA-binding transcriptional regulator AlpA
VIAPASPRGRALQSRLEVVSLAPGLLRDREAAAYLGRSPSWIRGWRAKDVIAIREGRAPTGPKWITIGRSVFYRLADIETWIAANATERGVIPFADRGGVSP